MMFKRVLRAALFCLTIGLVLTSSLFLSSAQRDADGQAEFPREFDVRGADGVPKGGTMEVPSAEEMAALSASAQDFKGAVALTQSKSLSALQSRAGGSLRVYTNGLTGTPRHLLSHSGYLTEARAAHPETIAREFLREWKDVFRFSDGDLSRLRLKSRSTVADMGTTIMLFEQEVDGVPVYQGQVLVNVNAAGQIINVGGESFPQLGVTNSFALAPEQAVASAASDLGVHGFAPEHLGTKKVLRTFGDLPHEYQDGQEFSGAGTFTDKIVVTRTIFPMGDTGRAAYRFVLTTPQFYGVMWENIVDAESGEVLRRTSLTSFQTGGTGTIGTRYGTFRPDVQDRVEAQSLANARGKVFDSYPTALSGRLGFGRSTAPGDPPDYQTNEFVTNANAGRGFKQSQVVNRIQGSLIYSAPFGQVLRGFPNAANPSAGSPFGWFYLPTSGGGAEINEADANRTTTRAYNYSMAAEAKARNLRDAPTNSPAGNGDQPFSADVTPLAAPVPLNDGRVLSSVIQSRYTEGNNTIVADDHQDDNETTHGVKGYSPNRQFTASHFDFLNNYEYLGPNATALGPEGFPESAEKDVYAATLALFYNINLVHDYLYEIGFTEATWNFQQDNFGKGGAGGDGVSGQVQDGSGINNANFGTGVDGETPRMQMFLWTEDATRRADGDFDFDVVAHEYYHGVSNRSVGKGSTGCLGVAFFGESGGQGEGWSDAIGESMTDDDGTGEYVTGEFDRAIRQIPMTNFRWSYATINRRAFTRRDGGTPDPNGSVSTNPTNVPVFQVHHVGTIFASILWDMRELMIVKDPNGIFFDGTRRLHAAPAPTAGTAQFFIGSRQVRSVDTRHPIDYRDAFGTHAIVPDANGVPTVIPNIKGNEHIVRPVKVAEEIATRRTLLNPNPRGGPLATAINNGARAADTLVLRGMQLSPCNPSFIDTRDSILAADRELYGGENQAVIWRAWASHGVGVNAQSTNSNPTIDPGSSMVPIVVEDFNVPAGVTTCEQQGPLPAPVFALTNTANNNVTVLINGGVPIPGAATYVISRSSVPGGRMVRIAEIPATQTVYNDNNGGQGLELGGTYQYQVRATRNPQCVSTANTQSITINVGVPVNQPAPIFSGVDQVLDPETGHSLIVSWLPAFSTNPNANIVYDIYRVEEPVHSMTGDEPTFTPSAANRIEQGVTGSSYVDNNKGTGLALAQAYYYIVQARDSASGKLDTNNTGNRIARYNAPTVQSIRSVIFPLENFENPTANSRFVPPLHEAGTNPRQDLQQFQRVESFNLGGDFVSDLMYAPNFSPGDEAGAPDPAGTHHGGPSDFSAVMGPFTNLTSTSVIEFNNAVNAEAFFDGGVVEISVGDPSFNGNSVTPNNVTLFDAADYILEGRYNSRLTGTIEGVRASPLYPRKAYTGVKGPHHVQITLNSFAPGRRHNLAGAPVYIRFRMSSDVASANGLDSGWYIDDLVIHNLGTAGPNPTPTPTPNPTPTPDPTPTPNPTPNPTPEPTPNPTPGPTPEPTPNPTPNPTPEPTPNPTPGPTPEPTPNPTPEPTPGPTPEPTPGPTPGPTPTASTAQFSASSYDVTEGCVAFDVTVTRTAPAGQPATVGFRTENGTATQRGDFTYAEGVLAFAAGETSKSFTVLISEDSYAEGTETVTLVLTSFSGVSAGNTVTAPLRINDNETADGSGNAIDDTSNFVCQHYHDFLNRQPDASGQAFWEGQIESCGADAACRDDRRQNVSAAFFLSIEFQQTGYYVIRSYKAAFGDQPGNPRYIPFLIDTREIGRGVVVGAPGWEQQLEFNKNAYINNFVARPDFQAAHGGQNAEQYVNSLFSNAGVTPTTAERNAAIAAYGAGGNGGQAAALKSVIDSGSVYNRLYNPGFVLMQYFGYLRRNADNPPDNNFSGYDFWLTKMNQFSVAGEDARDDRVAAARVRRAEMVRSFIVSGEYRGRFGVDPTRGNQFGTIAFFGPVQLWRKEVERAPYFTFEPAFVSFWRSD